MGPLQGKILAIVSQSRLKKIMKFDIKGPSSYFLEVLEVGEPYPTTPFLSPKIEFLLEKL